MAAQTEPFGTMADGRPVTRTVLDDGSLQVAILTMGAVLQDVRLPGVAHSLTVGSPDPAAYQGPWRSCGALIGPVVNRIAQGRALVSSRWHAFDRNQDGEHTRHSGSAGTHRALWELDEARPSAATFTLSMPDGQGGFPGNRVVAARYMLTGDATLEMRVAVTTDADTWVNFANHSYWNLDGTASYDGHLLQIAADRYCVTGTGQIPTGDTPAVEGTAFDFRAGRVLRPGADPRYDHNLCLAEDRRAPAPFLTLTGASGISMAMETTEPGVQIYDAAGFDAGGFADHAGRVPGAHAGLAIEAQGWPDAPNQRGFPSVILRAGRAYEQITRWRFSAP